MIRGVALLSAVVLLVPLLLGLGQSKPYPPGRDEVGPGGGGQSVLRPLDCPCWTEDSISTTEAACNSPLIWGCTPGATNTLTITCDDPAPFITWAGTVTGSGAGTCQKIIDTVGGAGPSTATTAQQSEDCYKVWTDAGRCP